MIRPGVTVKAMTGKTGTVLATSVPTMRGKNEPTKRVKVRLAPFVDATDGQEIPCLEAIYHADDLQAIGEE